MDEPSRIRVDSFTPSPLPPCRPDARLERAFARWGYSMDRAERRARTQKVIARRIRSRKAALGRLYLDGSPEPWRTRYLYEAVVGFERRWTFYEWLVKPGVLRKKNGAHGSCWTCEREVNARRDQPSLAWELENITVTEALTDMEPVPMARRKRRKNTKRWCRGKLGVPHRAHWRSSGSGVDSQLLACDACGKHLDWCFHPRWSFWSHPCRCPLGLPPPARGPPRLPVSPVGHRRCRACSSPDVRL